MIKVHWNEHYTLTFSFLGFQLYLIFQCQKEFNLLHTTYILIQTIKNLPNKFVKFHPF